VTPADGDGWGPVDNEMLKKNMGKVKENDKIIMIDNNRSSDGSASRSPKARNLP
jgi:hypothetical protein